ADSAATRRTWCFFFFQAEDGIRDDLVTGVQTCALPIWIPPDPAPDVDSRLGPLELRLGERPTVGVVVVGIRRWLLEFLQRACFEIGRASCRQRAGVVSGAGA